MSVRTMFNSPRIRHKSKVSFSLDSVMDSMDLLGDLASDSNVNWMDDYSDVYNVSVAPSSAVNSPADVETQWPFTVIYTLTFQTKTLPCNFAKHKEYKWTVKQDSQNAKMDSAKLQHALQQVLFHALCTILCVVKPTLLPNCLFLTGFKKQSVAPYANQIMYNLLKLM